MNLKDCKQGILVTCDNRIGMITGITNNAPLENHIVRREIERAIPIVSWSCGETSAIHYSNLNVFKG